MTGMLHQVKQMVRAVLPDMIVQRTTDSFNHFRYNKARKAFVNAGVSPAFLDSVLLPVLFGKYKFTSTYYYDPASIRQRGIERARNILDVIAKLPGHLQDFLELGCGDGMVSGILQEEGKTCTAVDFYDGGFDHRAIQSGVVFHKMDAATMKLNDRSFDFIFTYNAFEHFPHPEKVLAESLRVLRPGGYMLIEFSPLYMASYGMHAYKSIPVPYCHHLFRIEDMEKFIVERKLDPVNFTTHVNRWTLQQFRKLWKDHAHEMETIEYTEQKNYGDLNLIWKYPSCFRSKADNLDEFMVNGIRFLFRKK